MKRLARQDSFASAGQRAYRFGRIDEIDARRVPMDEVTAQARLSAEQIEAFHHTDFVEDQVRDFREMVGPSGDCVVLDIGGGCGFFAKRLMDTAGYPVRVMELDPQSVEACRGQGVEACLGDALAPDIRGDERIVSFNLILHHLVGANEPATRALQLKALRAWHGKGVRLFVNEYIYQSFVGAVSPRLIYEITSSRILSWAGRIAGKLIPAFRANTFGVGVRFRSHEQWLDMFAEAGFRIEDMRIGEPEPISPPLRTLLIKTIRRDSFLLESS